jgi:pimeloyl-ACP methyl ester carboxylesterase
MNIELERWKAAGKYFDYLGFNIFYRTEGSGPTLLLIHGSVQ